MSIGHIDRQTRAFVYTGVHLKIATWMEQSLLLIINMGPNMSIKKFYDNRKIF